MQLLLKEAWQCFDFDVVATLGTLQVSPVAFCVLGTLTIHHGEVQVSKTLGDYLKNYENERSLAFSSLTIGFSSMKYTFI